MLLRTRFYIPPLRDNNVVRAGLMQILNQSSGGSLVVISAPAGYGKTTLVSQWLHSNPHSFSWLALDKSLLTPDVFWTNVINSFQAIQPSLGINALTELKQVGDLFSPDKSSSIRKNSRLHKVVISILNDLDELSVRNNAKQPITLVLDDFHLIVDEEIVDSFNLFLDHLPLGVRVVLTARNEPSLCLGRRRASNQLVEIHGEELTFDLMDAKVFLRETMGLSIEAAEVKEIVEQTEGWAVGLQLAALAIKKKGCRQYRGNQGQGLSRDVSDYLFEEVFSLQGETLQILLVSTACSERFCASLANAITGKQDSLNLFKQLDQLNLFLVPLDNHRTWYRYHDLFRQFLIQRLEHTSAVDGVVVRQHAAKWFENAGYVDEAIDLLMFLGDWGDAVKLLSQVVEDGLQSSYDSRWGKWLSILPPEYRKQISSKFIQHSSGDSKMSISKSSPLITPSQIEPLTKREAEVMQWVQKGLSNKEIAKKLCISPNTLKVHIRNLYGKMGVETRTQAVLKVIPPINP